MDIIDKIKEIIKILNEIDDYNMALPQGLTELEQKQQDLLHYIENNKLSAFGSYRLFKEFKNIRIERRKVKNDIELSRTYEEYKNRLSSKNSRDFLLSELYKKEKSLKTKYNNRKYTEEELQEIIK